MKFRIVKKPPLPYFPFEMYCIQFKTWWWPFWRYYKEKEFGADYEHIREFMNLSNAIKKVEEFEKTNIVYQR